MKLTKAQQKVHEDLQRTGEFRCSPDYKPAQKLIELGLAEGHSGKFGSFWLTPKTTEASQ